MELRAKKQRKFVLMLGIGLSFTSAALANGEMCASLYSELNRPQVEKVKIPETRFDAFTRKLRETLSGKLATVWRSEWKTKLRVSESNKYVVEMVKKFLSPETQDFVLAGLNISGEGLVRKVHERIYQLQVSKRLTEADALLVRDMPPPPGARDTTFTYYTKALSNKEGEGKHQMRIRTYLREVIYEKIPHGESVQGFDSASNPIVISRLSESSFKVEFGKEGAKTEQVLDLNEMKSAFGKTARIFAPHGKSFKVEVKTALNDEISGDRFPILGGKHMVQKLDVSLSTFQVATLFAPLKGTTAESRIAESVERIEAVKKQVVEKNPDNQARADAVFEVMKAGVAENADFLVIEGATVYHRTAFESKSGFQTTIDRDQGVYAGNMYSSTALKNPIKTVQNNKLIKTSDEDARHVELKVPVTSIENTIGIQFYDPASAPLPQKPENDAAIIDAATIYSKYVRSIDHSGKFNYILKNGED